MGYLRIMRLKILIKYIKEEMLFLFYYNSIDGYRKIPI